MGIILELTEGKWNIIPKLSDRHAIRTSVNRVLGKAINTDISKEKSNEVAYSKTSVEFWFSFRFHSPLTAERLTLSKPVKSKVPRDRCVWRLWRLSAVLPSKPHCQKAFPVNTAGFAVSDCNALNYISSAYNYNVYSWENKWLKMVFTEITIY